MINEIEDKVSIALLQQQMEYLRLAVKELTDTQKEMSEDLKAFKTLITTGKWLAAAVFLTLGAIGHKSFAWIMQFFTN